ncbi:MAG: hypothetical protein US68_C0006G0056 [Candidatus Shapirobacteria bacterium GW2011_GWE1_38_10]|uniref:Glycosyltransferase RgtA/B/C/D-like domain-containing protein n=1 Tax=Candidatus Shapirobacteria bacterium GW2011_GWE1_38_10 TaxID=1618488 RepID=A0A0G0LCJ8_9BACT|nr:MAG: hypothetical protein US46_C0002G0123 [Candidatus Shapirobacteria bacterium GW2011_GWF2_37_20]KKQ50376.1 MAG: hypothetical protein US68_C0006G0056 [Candidatus Shapirobacteria bacterium GW2011_GWE1_38_10]KKQ65200.1 MAG: hypothetical protein US85_C0001G0127 [Candidatus Shapirobacteria bacterium GW2011_GWF1_38_23]HBP51306.1 hypothetical protein [Candidatus Shapirobacteria bacterium]
MNNNLSKIIKLFVIPIVIFFVFFVIYKTKATNINSRYLFDEYAWIGRGYYFELLLKGDFKNNLWETYEIDGDPKLASYLYGLTLYPDYLKEKKIKGNDYDMVRYLIENNFYISGFFNNLSKQKYDKYLPENFISWQESGAPRTILLADLLKQFGGDFEKTVNIITKARLGSVVFLSLSVSVAYLIFISTFNSIIVSLLMTFLYGFSSLLTRYGLVAYSEPIYLFLFNLLLLNLFLFFSNKKQRFLFIIPSIIICAFLNQAKISGVLFLPLIIFLLIIDSFGKDIKMFFIKIFFIIYFFLLIYITIDPFLYSNTLRKVVFQYQWTHNMSVDQQTYFKSNALLKIKDKISFINKSLLNNGNQSLTPFVLSNNIYINSFIRFIKLFFIFGLIKSILEFIKEKQLTKRKVMLIVFVYFYVSLLFYLRLTWDRYLIHMLIFVFYFTGQGIMFGFQLVKYLQLKAKR